MAITRWDPFAELTTMERNFDRLLSSFTRPPLPVEFESVVWMPTTDVLTRGEDLVVRAELPGVRAGDVDIAVTDRMLTIKGERKLDTESEKAGYVMRESLSGTFQRSMTLPEGVDPEKMTASFADGVLEIVVPKAAALERHETHHIPLTSGEMEAPMETSE